MKRLLPLYALVFVLASGCDHAAPVVAAQAADRVDARATPKAELPCLEFPCRPAPGPAWRHEYVTVEEFCKPPADPERQCFEVWVNGVKRIGTFYPPISKGHHTGFVALGMGVNGQAFVSGRYGQVPSMRSRKRLTEIQRLRKDGRMDQYTRLRREWNQ